MSETIHIEATTPDIDLCDCEFDVTLVGKYGLELTAPDDIDISVTEDTIQLPAPSEIGLDSGWTYRIEAEEP